MTAETGTKDVVDEIEDLVVVVSRENAAPTTQRTACHTVTAENLTLGICSSNRFTKLSLQLPPALRTCTSPDTFPRHLNIISSRLSNSLDAFILAPQIRLPLTIELVYKWYLLTYLLTKQWAFMSRVFMS